VSDARIDLARRPMSTFPSPSPRTWRQKLARALVTTLLVFGLVEISLRVTGFRFHGLDLPIAIWNPDEDKALNDASALHRSSLVSLWEPRPGASIPWGANELVNEGTFRGPDVAAQRTPGTLRIATLGDSSTFGYGVAWEECWSARLASAARTRGNSIEVIDGGVIGFTIRQGIERYKARVRPLRPDVVVAAFGAVNEHTLAPGEVPDVAKLEQVRARSSVVSRSARWVRGAVRVLHLLDWVRCEITDEKSKRLAAWTVREQNRTLGIEVMGALDYAEPRRVSPTAFAEALAELRREVEADGARLVLVSMPRSPGTEELSPILAEYTRVLEDFARTAAVPVADARAAFRDEAAAGRGEGLFLSGDRWHPTARGHAVLAERIAPLVEAAAAR